MMNNVGGTSFGCGHCRDAASKFIKEGIPVDNAKQVVQSATRGSEYCRSEEHCCRARRYNFSLGLFPERLQSLVASLKQAGR